VRRLLLIGIGTGDSDQVTVAAVRALNAFDVLFLVTKDGLDDLAAFRREMIARHRVAGSFRTVELPDPPRPWRTAPDYAAAVREWRQRRVTAWEAAISGHLNDDDTGAFLVWGDPSLYESTLAVVGEIAERSEPHLDYEVVPGVSSIHALTARHRIPLNRVGRAVQITPGRLLDGGLPAGVDDFVVMLDSGAAFARIPAHGLEIYWGAYLGTDEEILISGPLAEVAERIIEARETCRERRGWLFDIYLLRRVG
jgi:precorrin-6A synthase